VQISCWSRIRGVLAAFGRSDRANIAVIFAIACVPMIAAVGSAIDYTRANAARSSMQAALDSTALMVAKDLSSGAITTSQVTTKAQAYFTALYTNKNAQSVTIAATYTAATGNAAATVAVNGSGSITTNFMKIAGFPTVGFNSSSTSTWGTSLLRVALALDVTGSMANYGKLAAMQTAAKSLVTQLASLAKSNGDVYISVIPFEADVNVGTSNVNAGWLRWDLWDPSNYSDSRYPWNTYCNNGYWLTRAQCVGHGYTWNRTVGTPSRSLWNGCVTDRDQSYDTTSTVPSASATQFVADQEQSCPSVAIVPLTYNWTTINNAIDALTAQGGTNQPIGLHWAWLSLLQQDPLNAPAESQAGATYQKVILLFTDGLNTGNRWYGNFSSTSTEVDTRMQTLCTNIKASGVTIFTVQIDTEGVGQSAVLPACASSSSNYFLLTAASQISAAFSQIGTSISKLRVAK
jgi:Flp pilus assembly protein TadG